VSEPHTANYRPAKLRLLRASYLGQKLTVPIALASADDDIIALWAALVPVAATALYFAFVARPRQKRKRARSADVASRAVPWLSGPI
jgi:hypothetical protein